MSIQPALDRAVAVREPGDVQVAMALSPGVSADECEAFAAVFGNLDGAELVGVGERLGAVGGPGGGHWVDALFDDVQHPEIVLVPGGLGCARAAADPVLLDWIRLVAPRCDWLVASSTGTVVVAAAGLLGHQPAATHWLAGDLLVAHGSSASTERIVEIGNIITCEGWITAMHVALLVTLRVAGPVGVAQVRELLAASNAPPRHENRWKRWRDRNRPSGPHRPRNRQLDAPDVIEFDPLVIHPS